MGSSFEEAKVPFKWAGISHIKLFSPKPGWFSDFLMILQSITCIQPDWKPTGLPYKHKMKISPVKRASPICLLALLTSSTTAISFQRCLLRYYELDEQRKRPDSFLNASSFLVYSVLKVQNESCDLEKSNRCGGVWDCDSPHASRSWKIQLVPFRSSRYWLVLQLVSDRQFRLILNPLQF